MCIMWIGFNLRVYIFYKKYAILSLVVTMKIIYIAFLLFLLSLFNGCQTIESKSQKAIKKENEKLSKFLQQPESELKVVMGEPSKITYDAKGSKFFIYSKKKYNITCERKFEIDQNNMIVGFTSKGCF